MKGFDYLKRGDIFMYRGVITWKVLDKTEDIAECQCIENISTFFNVGEVRRFNNLQIDSGYELITFKQYYNEVHR